MATKDLQYDAIVIGSGQGGNPLAQQLASCGKQVALIESNLVGGTCINTGCTPTKTMIASAQVAHYGRDGVRWGIHSGDVGVDLPAMVKRKDEIVRRFRSGWESTIEQQDGLVLHRGRGRFIGPKQIQVGEIRMTAEKIFIDTGSTPNVPSIPGLSSVPFFTNETLLNLTQLPSKLIVLGGGYVGLEFAQMFRRFGAEVEVIHRGGQILPREDADVIAQLQKSLESEGIRFFMNAQTTRVEQQSNRIALTIHAGQNSQVIAGSHLLVAVGRTPQTKDLDLGKAGIQVNEKGAIVVNDRLETTAPGVWAMGDVTGGPAFTHISYNDFQIIYGNVYEGQSLSTSERLVPYAVYTDPTLGRVGITESEARKTGYKLKIGSVPMERVARARERGETAGLMKLVVDAETDMVLGAAILSSEGGELVQILSTLMLAEKPYTLLKGAIYIHPTLAEGFFSLMDSVKPA